MSKVSLPYCTVKGFRRCLEILRDAEAGRKVDRQFLLEKGFWPHAVYPVLGALRFLGLIEEDGTRTSALQPFLTDDVAGRVAAVEKAYGPVLETVSFPVEDREEVDKILIKQHGSAPGVAAFCSTFFLWLAAEAGLPVAVAGPRRRGRPPAHLSQLSPEAAARLRENGRRLRSGQEVDPVFRTGRPGDAAAASAEPPRAQPSTA